MADNAYVEELLFSLETLPVDLDRNMRLIRELDSRVCQATAELDALHSSALDAKRKRVALHGSKDLKASSAVTQQLADKLGKIKEVHHDATAQCAVKLAIANQAQSMVHLHLNRIEVRRTGEREKAPPPPLSDLFATLHNSAT